MKRLKKVKKKQPESIPASDQKAAPPSEERVRTSLLLNQRIYLASKRAARQLGVSFNAYASMALAEKNERRVVVKLDDQVIARSVARSLASDESGGAGRILAGYTFPSEEGPATFVRWEDVARFADEQRKDPEANFLTIGKRLGMDLDVARAADVAQGTEEFEAWMSRRRQA